MAAETYEFGGFRLDSSQRTLFDGTGKPYVLAPRVFDTLLYLVQNAGELVEKNALIEAVWPDVMVEDNSLTQNISTLRRALGDKTGENRFIVTAPGRGYRFVAKVSVSADSAASPSQKSKTIEPAFEKVRVSIAVMPFANLTGDPDQEYFSDGMAEEIINLLTRISLIKTPSRTSSFAYKGRKMDLRQIAEDLGVDAVLEGSVRAAGKRARVTAQLIDGASGFHLWSETYDRDMTDIFALQDELALSILEAMQTHLNTPLSNNRRPRARTKDLEAYRLYLQAESMRSNSLAAADIYRQALDRDPDFARAQAGYASAEAFRLSFVTPTKEQMAEVEAHAKKALALDSQSEAGHSALGNLYVMMGKLCDGERHIRKTIELGDDPMVKNGLCISIVGNAGHLRRALQLSEEVYRSLPISGFLPVATAMFQMSVGNDEAARFYVAKALENGQPNSSVPLSDVLALLSVCKGEFEKAAEFVLDSMQVHELSGGVASAIRETYMATGDVKRRPNALKLLRDPDIRERMMTTPINYKRMLFWLVVLGEIDDAFDWMDRVLKALEAEGSVGMIWVVIWLPDMKPFRDDPRFNDIARRLGFHEYWRENGPPDGYDFRDGKLISL